MERVKEELLIAKSFIQAKRVYVRTTKEKREVDVMHLFIQTGLRISSITGRLPYSLIQAVNENLFFFDSLISSTSSVTHQSQGEKESLQDHKSTSKPEILTLLQLKSEE